MSTWGMELVWAIIRRVRWSAVWTDVWDRIDLQYDRIETIEEVLIRRRIVVVDVE